MTQTKTIPLEQYVATCDGLAAVGRIFGKSGQCISLALSRGRDIHIVTDAITGQPIRAVEVKKLWEAIDRP